MPYTRDASGFSQEQYRLRMLNVDRLGLIEEFTRGGLGPDTRYIGGGTGSLGLTPLGRGLVTACRGPQTGESGEGAA
jgi:hypothetical protein